MFSPITNRWDLVVSGTGHKGDRVYAGCGTVWKGLNKLLQPVNYTTVFGGAPVSNLVTMSV